MQSDSDLQTSFNFLNKQIEPWKNIQLADGKSVIK